MYVYRRYRVVIKYNEILVRYMRDRSVRELLIYFKRENDDIPVRLHTTIKRYSCPELSVRKIWSTAVHTRVCTHTASNSCVLEYLGPIYSCTVLFIMAKYINNARGQRAWFLQRACAVSNFHNFFIAKSTICFPPRGHQRGSASAAAQARLEQKIYVFSPSKTNICLRRISLSVYYLGSM